MVVRFSLVVIFCLKVDFLFFFRILVVDGVGVFFGRFRFRLVRVVVVGVLFRLFSSMEVEVVLFVVGRMGLLVFGLVLFFRLRLKLMFLFRFIGVVVVKIGFGLGWILVVLKLDRLNFMFGLDSIGLLGVLL